MGIKRYLGGVVSANPDTPTVESASGVWTVEEAYQNIGNWPMAGNQIQDSLRFDSAATAYLSWTPSSAGNRKTWTWSGWVKRANLAGDFQVIFGAGTSCGSGERIALQFTSSDQLATDVCGVGVYNVSNNVYRDPSAWYHIVWKFDTTQVDANSRSVLYVNGEPISDQYTRTFTQNSEHRINDTQLHAHGALTNSIGTYNFSGYMTEVNFIDGLALGPEYFGFTDGNGIWQPKQYKGAYGANGFYLPMTESATAQGFSTVVYEANASTNKISGVGFQPDFVWCKSRDNAYNHDLYDSVRGSTKNLQSNSTNAEGTDANSLKSFDPDGFTLGYNENSNYTANTSSVAWCWKAGGSGGSSNTDGTITSTVSANTDYGFSIITHTGTGANGTIGHGLGVAPKFVLTKRRSASESWTGWHTGLSGGTYNIELNTTNGEQSSPTHYTAVPTSSVINLGTNTASNASGSTYVTYAFAEISGYSKFGSYTGNGSSTGPTVTTGFKPAFVITKGINGTTTYKNWNLHDNTRDTVNPVSKFLQANTTGAEGDTGALNIQFNDDGFQILSTDPGLNTSGDTYIYAAFADTRAYSFWDDQSGNGNNWQPNNIGFEDIMVDSPTNFGTDTGAGGEVRGNYATLNPVGNYGGTLSNGNLDHTSAGQWVGAHSTISMPSGKWYCEYTATDAANFMVGIVAANGTNVRLLGTANSGYPGKTSDGYGWINNANKINNDVSTAYGSAPSNGDVIMVAFDADNGGLYVGKNGTWFNSSNPATATSPMFSSIPMTSAYYFCVGNEFANGSMNFGQTPFVYAAPSGYKALCTQNLPEPTVVDGGEYFNTLLYTGDGVSGRTLTGVGFQPDFTWIKNRVDGSDDNQLYDAVRTAGKLLKANTTDAEATTTGGLTAFAPDGFVTGSSHGTNASGQGIVAWNWKAGGSGVSNTDGSITSTVSANPTAGFSIVTYTGNGSTGTVGHGLGAAPSMIIVKVRSTTNDWGVGHASIGWNQAGLLNLTNSFGSSSYFNSTAPTSTVFSVGASAVTNTGSATYVAYCFAPIAGYSAFGSYTGNGSADGPFIYTGFRPAWVMVKRTNSTENWQMSDDVRNGGYNVVNKQLLANSSAAENTEDQVDYLANGFKVRASGTGWNASGSTYIYAAFAENPFKLSRAR